MLTKRVRGQETSATCDSSEWRASGKHTKPRGVGEIKDSDRLTPIADDETHKYTRPDPPARHGSVTKRSQLTESRAKTWKPVIANVL